VINNVQVISQVSEVNNNNNMGEYGVECGE
jgi:hypothetical protein